MVAYMRRLGALGFGGPIALVGYMHRDLVESRKWVSEADYKEGLALSQVAPGPLAAQLAIYLGYVHYRVLGATLVGITFVIPSFIIVAATTGAALSKLRRAVPSCWVNVSWRVTATVKSLSYRYERLC